MKLTERDKLMVKMLSEGKKPAEIGFLIELSPRTVETYLEKIRHFYGALTAAHLVAIFLKNKIID